MGAAESRITMEGVLEAPRVFNGHNSMLAADQALLSQVAEAVKAAGKVLLRRFFTGIPPREFD